MLMGGYGLGGAMLNASRFADSRGVFAGIVENGHPNGASHREMLPRIAAQLVRNSAQPPVPAVGVRGQRRTCRTALYRADGYSIELRLEHEPGSRRLDISGQIANSRHPRSKLRETTVLLMSGKDLVALAVSDALGRFQMQCAPARSLHLHVSLEPRGQGIEVPLGVLTSRFLWDGGKPESDSPAARAR